MEGSGVIRRYRDFLPITDTTPIISLSEGSTPLIEAPNIVQALGGGFRLFVKYEGLNPTGSFKDRGMTLAVSKAAERGVRAIVCASTGHTSASGLFQCSRAAVVANHYGNARWHFAGRTPVLNSLEISSASGGQDPQAIDLPLFRGVHSGNP